jgi:hypothetical protein
VQENLQEVHDPKQGSNNQNLCHSKIRLYGAPGPLQMSAWQRPTRRGCKGRAVLLALVSVLFESTTQQYDFHGAPGPLQMSGRQRPTRRGCKGRAVLLALVSILFKSTTGTTSLPSSAKHLSCPLISQPIHMC